MKAVFLYVTFSDASQAESLGRQAIEGGLAACLNLFPAHRALYHWEGKIESSAEFVGLFKTTDLKIDELEAFLKREHPYSTPCLARFTPQLNAEFMNWLTASTSTSTSTPI